MISNQPDSPVEPEKEKQILKALHEANWKQVQLVYALEIDRLIKAEVVKELEQIPLVEGQLPDLKFVGEEAIVKHIDSRLAALKQEMKDG